MYVTFQGARGGGLPGPGDRGREHRARGASRVLAHALRRGRSRAAGSGWLARGRHLPGGGDPADHDRSRAAAAEAARLAAGDRAAAGERTGRGAALGAFHHRGHHYRALCGTPGGQERVLRAFRSAHSPAIAVGLAAPLRRRCRRRVGRGERPFPRHDRCPECCRPIPGGAARPGRARRAGAVHHPAYGRSGVFLLAWPWGAHRGDDPLSGAAPGPARLRFEPRAGAGGARTPQAVRCARLPGLLRAAPRQERDLLRVGEGRDLLPGGGRRHAGQRRSARRRRGLARGDQGVHGQGTQARMGTGRDRMQSDRRQGLVRQAGLSALEIGDEAVVEVAGFGLEGREMRNVRQMVHRIERAGYVCAVRRGADLGAQERTASGRLRRLGQVAGASGGSRWPWVASAIPPTPTAWW